MNNTLKRAANGGRAMTEPTKERKVADKVVSVKGFDANMQCRGYQFEVGKTYTHDGKVVVCKSGFHACENPLDVLNYYNICDSRFALVEQSGEIARHDGGSKVASSAITIQAELRLPDFIRRSVAWIMSASETNEKIHAASGSHSKLAASGSYSRLAASGDSSQLAASGSYSKLAASGDSSQLAASGNDSKLAASGSYSQLAASGYSSQLAASGSSSQLAASGDYSQLAASGSSSKLAASGYSSIAMAASCGSRAKAGSLGAIALTWNDGERPRISVGYVGEELKPDTWYELNSRGEFVEVEG